MNIRPAVTDDYPPVRELLVAAFGGIAEADLVERLRAHGDAMIELVADDSGTIVGHILFSPLEAPFRALALAPVAVTPDRQRSGIGSALIREGHALARAAEWEGSFVLGEPEYYRRFGYRADLASGFDSPYSGPYFMALALAGTLPAVTGEVRHAPAFADLS